MKTRLKKKLAILVSITLVLSATGSLCLTAQAESVTLICETFSNVTNGAAITNTNTVLSSIVSNASYAKWVGYSDSGNMVARVTGTNSASPNTKNYPRLEKSFAVSDLDNFTLTARMKCTSDTSTRPELKVQYALDGTSSSATTLTTVSASTWTDIRIVFDFAGGVAQVYKNNVAEGQVSFQSGTYTTCLLKFDTAVVYSQSVWIDDILITTSDDASDPDAWFDTRGNLRYHNVTTDDSNAFGNSMRQTHPRIHVNDFGAIYSRIQTYDEIRSCYENLRAYTISTYLTADRVTYNDSVRDNIINNAREIMKRVYCCSFVYNVEQVRYSAGDVTRAEKIEAYITLPDLLNARDGSTSLPILSSSKKTQYRNGTLTVADEDLNTRYLAYLDMFKFKAYDEIINAGTYPSWTPNAFLCTAELSQGVAVGYDWLYHYLTQAERDTIMEILLRQGITPYVKEYEGQNVSNTKWIGTKHNWNVVCNGSAIIAAMSVYDYYPNLANYLFSKARSSIRNGLEPYSNNGNFPETAMYWQYSTNYVLYTISALKGALADGISMPAQYDFAAYSGLNRTAYYSIGYFGAKSLFNFGDAKASTQSMETIGMLGAFYNDPIFTTYAHTKKVEFQSPSDMRDVYNTIWLNPELINPVYEDALPLDYFADAPRGVTADKLNHHGASMRSAFEPDMLFAAVQGGSITANHNFYSIGTFVLDANGERWFTQRGSSNYSASLGKTYYYGTRAEGQNTVVIPTDSKNGVADQNQSGFGELIAKGSNDNTAYAIFDMTSSNTKFTSAKRGIMLTDHRSKVILQDEFTASTSSDFWWFAHTPADIEIRDSGKSALLTLNGQRLWVHIVNDGGAGLVFETKQAIPLDYNATTNPGPSDQTLFNKDGKPKYGYKLAIHGANLKNFKVSVEYVPLKSGDSVPSQSQTAYRALSAWSLAELYADDDMIWSDNANTAWYTVNKTLYTIGTPQELAGLAQLVNAGTSFEGKTIKLSQDIDLSGAYWVPIGTRTAPFKGAFNGDGYSILGLTIYSKRGLQGLFGYANGATLQNLRLVSPAMNAPCLVGALAGAADYTLIRNIGVESGTAQGTTYIGGLAGSAVHSTIKNCYVLNTSVANKAYGGETGGLVGFTAFGTLTNSYYRGTNSSVQTAAAGGVAGHAAETEMTNVFFTSSTAAKTLVATGDPAITNTGAFNTSTGYITYTGSSSASSDRVLAKLRAYQSSSSDTSLMAWTGGNANPTLLWAQSVVEASFYFTLSEPVLNGAAVQCKVTNETSAASQAILVAAAYKNDVLVDMHIVDSTLGANASATPSVTFKTTDFDTVKLFVLRDVTTMQILSNLLTASR